MSNKMKEEERKRLSGHIRKCLESQKDREFILQIPLKRGASEREKKIRNCLLILPTRSIRPCRYKTNQKPTSPDNYRDGKPCRSCDRSLNQNRQFEFFLCNKMEQKVYREQ